MAGNNVTAARKASAIDTATAGLTVVNAGSRLTTVPRKSGPKAHIWKLLVIMPIGDSNRLSPAKMPPPRVPRDPRTAPFDGRIAVLQKQDTVTGITGIQCPAAGPNGSAIPGGK